jgi:predicted site-specific integrase-resolvase
MRRIAAPVYDSELGFYRAMGIRWETGRHYRRLGVLKPDAESVGGRPLFLADLATIEKAKAAIVAHRVSQSRARANLQELSHV